MKRSVLFVPLLAVILGAGSLLSAACEDDEDDLGDEIEDIFETPAFDTPVLETPEDGEEEETPEDGGLETPEEGGL